MLDRRKSCLSFILLLFITLPYTLSIRTHHQHQQQHVLHANIDRSQHQQEHIHDIQELHHNHKTTHELDDTQDLASTHNIHAYIIRDTNTNQYQYHSEYVSNTNIDTYIPPNNAIAWMIYEPTIQRYGWDVLSIKTSSLYNDNEQAYTAGYIEGRTTYIRIRQLWSTIGKKRHPDVDKYIQQQDTYIRHKISIITSSDQDYQYWIQVSLIISQLDGIYDGYTSTITSTTSTQYHMSIYDFWSLQLDGDMKDIERMVISSNKNKTKCSDMSRTELLEFIATTGHCSVLIKYTQDDLYITHATWADYDELLKIYKHYNFQFTNPSIKSRVSSFSSYPGFIWSSDDFYILDTGLVITETTITILNDDIYQYNAETSLTSWIRTSVANRLASTGYEWTQIFSQYNSGTYNCQWMIVDYNLFVKGDKSLKPGTLYVLEQIPGKIQVRDMTPVLQSSSYWGSYNLPYFTEINELSMYQHYANRYGETLEYEKSPRAQIMKREQDKITSVAALKRFSRLNQYVSDPLSGGCPGEAIAARYDLPKTPGVTCDGGFLLNGAVDAKVVSSAMVAAHVTETVCGPSSDDQPPFDWSQVRGRSKPPGQATRYDFPWITTSPRL